MSIGPLIFLHIPKAAGTTLERLIVTHHPHRAWQRFTGSPSQYLDFLRLPAAKRDRFDLLSGHVHFGLHHHLPRPSTYVTMLRDPVERVISHYHFARQHPTHYLHHIATRPGMTLERYARLRPSHELDNDQVRWLCLAPHFKVPVGHVSRAMLDEARFHLLHAIAAVGIAERFQESVELIAAALQWPDAWRTTADWSRDNATRDRPPAADLDPHTLDAIRDTNALECELYAAARDALTKGLARWGVYASP